MKANAWRRWTRLAPLVVCGLWSAGCGSEGDEGTSGDLHVRVQTIPVERRDLLRTLEIDGVVEAGRSVDLLPTTQGRVASVAVAVGQRVDRGQVLLRLDRDLLRLQRDQAAAARGLAELQVGTAERGYERARVLHEEGTLTEEQWEKTASGLEMARLQLAQAEAALGMAEEQLEGAVLVAPFAGSVSYVAAEPEDLFNPLSMSGSMSGFGGPAGLVGVVDLDTLRVDLEVSDRDVSRLHAGMPARVEVDVVSDRLPPRGLPGEVIYVGEAADPASRTFPVRVEAENPDHVVRAGMHARVGLVLEERNDVLAIPPETLRSEQDRSYVMVARGGVARRVFVEKGLEGDRFTEVLDGLQAGDAVIREGSFGLPDGARIEVTP